MLELSLNFVRSTFDAEVIFALSQKSPQAPHVIVTPLFVTLRCCVIFDKTSTLLVIFWRYHIMSFSPEISFSNFRKKSSFFNVASRPRGSCGNRPDEESTRRSLVDPLDTTDHFKEETRRLYQNVLQQMRRESQITARKEYRGESRGDIQSIEQTVQGRNVSDSSNLASMTNAFENPFLEGVNDESSTQ